MRYALTRWEGLSRFLDDGRVDLDSNTVERSIRPLALNRNYAKCRIMRRWGCLMGPTRRFRLRISHSPPAITHSPLGDTASPFLPVIPSQFMSSLLIGPFRFAALEGVILNKAISLVVVAAALVFRTRTVPLEVVAAHRPLVLNLLAGALSEPGSGRDGPVAPNPNCFTQSSPRYCFPSRECFLSTMTPKQAILC